LARAGIEHQTKSKLFADREDAARVEVSGSPFFLRPEEILAGSEAGIGHAIPVFQH
ncbi:MAG: hypothetical protein JNL61_01095, partial [Rhizobiaceae bacterium]|nr:hypothetical protein [Rhizobiaceae bacterium]